MNSPSTINDEGINRIPQVPINEGLDDLSTLLETLRTPTLQLQGAGFLRHPSCGLQGSKDGCNC
ncbi:hypothetical protein DPMN_075883 [Dreissena polymorpha]|uniref:Uncharacterized protein n=1 Tax=Dreissena polymorpha TaxID=45954 RepID=A0A9D3YI32_DREPO|nr:hypothetical protein DPMN_075883 [Dreissena polymorpha]